MIPAINKAKQGKSKERTTRLASTLYVSGKKDAGAMGATMLGIGLGIYAGDKIYRHLKHRKRQQRMQKYLDARKKAEEEKKNTSTEAFTIEVSYIIESYLMEFDL